MSNERNYYPVNFIMANVSYYSVWIEDLKDSFVSCEKRILVFLSEAEMKEYCIQNSFDLNESSAVYNLDELKEWLNTNNSEVDPVSFLNFWNIFMDVSATVKQKFLGDEDSFSIIYSKLFHGNNLPAVNQSGKKYIPEWDDTERNQIREVMKNGLNLFEHNLFFYSDKEVNKKFEG